MIKEEKVLIKINTRNITHFVMCGYVVILSDKILNVYIKDLNNGSKVKVTAICEICESENFVQYNKYLINKNRNNKGYYSCFSCKNIECKKTCLKKYGVDSYSKTDIFKKAESLKYKGIKKGHEKSKETCLKKYGVDSYFKTNESKNRNRKWMSSDEFIRKSKETCLKKYGVDSYSKTDEFKKKISDDTYDIVSKIKKRFMENYGVDWYSKTDQWKKQYKLNKGSIISKIKETCLDRYGFDNVSKVGIIKSKSKKTKIERGIIIPDELLTQWMLYKRECRRLTKPNSKILYENWDGFDYYDGENIIGYQSLTHTNRYYPTVDHKISVYYGFVNNITPYEISHIDNLCITKRFINSKKRDLIESEFIL
jgi:hypothetical protein